MKPNDTPPPADDPEAKATASDTPECDNEAFVATYDYWETCDAVRLKFAEQLERERNTARIEAEKWRRVAARYAGCTEDHCNRLPWEPSWDEHQRALKDARQAAGINRTQK